MRLSSSGVFALMKQPPRGSASSTRSWENSTTFTAGSLKKAWARFSWASRARRTAARQVSRRYSPWNGSKPQNSY